MDNALLAGEFAAIGETIQTRSDNDSRLAKKLIKHSAGVTGTGERLAVARRTLTTTEFDPEWRVHPTPGPRKTDSSTYTETFDQHVPMISARSLAFVEVLFVVAEVFFWYQTFSFDVEGGWLSLSRWSALLLALLVPAAGVFAARLTGSLGHRVIKRHPGGSSKVAIVVPVVLLIVLVAVFWMVFARFSVKAAGAAETPAVPLAMVFVVVLMADMLARVFMVSEIREQYHARKKQYDRRVAAFTKANKEHNQSWEALRFFVQRHYQQADRVEVVGASLVHEARAHSGNPDTPLTLPESVAALTDGAGDAPALPKPPGLGWFGANVPLAPMRCLMTAVDVLRKWPPLDKAQLDEFLDKDWNRVCGIQGDRSPQAAPDANGQTIPLLQVQHGGHHA